MNQEAYPHDNQAEIIRDPEALMLLKSADKLKYLYLINKLSLPAIPEDLQEMILWRGDGKQLAEFILPLSDDIDKKWKQLIIEEKLPSNTSEALKTFSEQISILIEKMRAVTPEIKMTNQEMTEIQNITESIIETLGTILRLKPKG